MRRAWAIDPATMTASESGRWKGEPGVKHSSRNIAASVDLPSPLGVLMHVNGVSRTARRIRFCHGCNSIRLYGIVAGTKRQNRT